MLTVLLCACSIFGRYLCIIDLWSECEQYCCHWGWKNILEISRVYSRAGECYKRSEKEEMEKVNGVFIFFVFVSSTNFHAHGRIITIRNKEALFYLPCFARVFGNDDSVHHR